MSGWAPSADGRVKGKHWLRHPDGREGYLSFMDPPACGSLLAERVCRALDDHDADMAAQSQPTKEHTR